MSCCFFSPFLQDRESRYLGNLRVILCFVIYVLFCFVLFFTLGTINYKFDKSFFKMVVLKSVLEIVSSPLLRPSYFIQNLQLSFWYLLVSIVLSNIKSLQWALLKARTFLKIIFLVDQKFLVFF